jgi:hypothetical protein
VSLLQVITFVLKSAFIYRSQYVRTLHKFLVSNYHRHILIAIRKHLRYIVWWRGEPRMTRILISCMFVCMYVQFSKPTVSEPCSSVDWGTVRLIHNVWQRYHHKKVKCTLLQALRLCTDRAAHRGSRGIALIFLDHGTRRGWGVSVTPRPLFTPGKNPVPIVQEAGLVPGPVWTGAENLASTGIRSPDRPARSQSLYRTRYPAHNTIVIIYAKIISNFR